MFRPYGVKGLDLIMENQIDRTVKNEMEVRGPCKGLTGMCSVGLGDIPPRTENQIDKKLEAEFKLRV